MDHDFRSALRAYRRDGAASLAAPHAAALESAVVRQTLEKAVELEQAEALRFYVWLTDEDPIFSVEESAGFMGGEAPSAEIRVIVPHGSVRALLEGEVVEPAGAASWGASLFPRLWRRFLGHDASAADPDRDDAAAQARRQRGEDAA